MPASDLLAPIVHALLGDAPPVRLELWDGSSIGPADGGAGTLRVHSPDAFRRLLWSPNELGIARAYVVGDLDADGDIFELVAAVRGCLPEDKGELLRLLPTAVRTARRLGVLGRPLPPPPEEARLHGGRHSVRRDAAAIEHHYDVGNDFYRLVLGPSMTYSCARFVDEASDLTAAQQAKHDLICRKLGLDTMRDGRLLDVGCGWGSMAIHAASHYDVSRRGHHDQRGAGRAGTPSASPTPGLPTASRSASRTTATSAPRRSTRSPRSACPSTSVTATWPATTSCSTLRCDRPAGCSTTPSARSAARSSAGRRSSARYVFPDGELIDVGESVLAMERAGFEVRDVESLREHYARTLRAWVGNLEAAWDEAVALVGEARARVWRLYMAGSAIGFMDNGIAIHQVLGVVPTADGASGMPATRRSFEAT